MKKEYVSPFISAAMLVIEAEAKAKVMRGALELRVSRRTMQEVTVLLGLTGDVQGTITFGLSQETARNLVGAILGEPQPEFTPDVESGIAEMGNMIVGRASMELESGGFSCEITPPTVFVGKGATFTTFDTQQIMIPLETMLGRIEMGVALRAAH